MSSNPGVVVMMLLSMMMLFQNNNPSSMHGLLSSQTCPHPFLSMSVSMSAEYISTRFYLLSATTQFQFFAPRLFFQTARARRAKMCTKLECCTMRKLFYLPAKSTSSSVHFNSLSFCNANILRCIHLVSIKIYYIPAPYLQVCKETLLYPLSVT